MLSKNQRKVLEDLFNLVIKYGELKDQKEELDKEKGQKLIEKMKIGRNLKDTEEKLFNYFSDYSINRKRVFKHRLLQKADMLMNDLILLHKTHWIFERIDKDIKIRSLFQNWKYRESMAWLPNEAIKYFFSEK